MHIKEKSAWLRACTSQGKLIKDCGGIRNEKVITYTTQTAHVKGQEPKVNNFKSLPDLARSFLRNHSSSTMLFPYSQVEYQNELDFLRKSNQGLSDQEIVDKINNEEQAKWSEWSKAGTVTIYLCSCDNGKNYYTLDKPY